MQILRQVRPSKALAQALQKRRHQAAPGNHRHDDAQGGAAGQQHQRQPQQAESPGGRPHPEGILKNFGKRACFQVQPHKDRAYQRDQNAQNRNGGGVKSGDQNFGQDIFPPAGTGKADVFHTPAGKIAVDKQGHPDAGQRQQEAAAQAFVKSTRKIPVTEK